MDTHTRNLLVAARAVVFNYHRDNLDAEDVACLRDEIEALLPDWTPHREAIELGTEAQHYYEDEGRWCDECGVTCLECRATSPEQDHEPSCSMFPKEDE